MSERLYHGGVGGLTVGDWLLPPSVTGWRPPRLQLRINGMTGSEYLGPEINRSDRVYLTTDRLLAYGYAGARCIFDRTFGAVYLAQPDEVELDPDLPKVSVQCTRARIVRVFDPVVRLSAGQVQQRLARHIEPLDAVR